MSSLKDKMGNYEVMPPVNTWDRIAAALDESMQEARFPPKLRATEIEPPAMAWDKISGELDNETKNADYPARLQAMEINPPANAWNKIASALEQEQKPEAIVISQPSIFNRVIRYAVAAAVVGAVAFGILQWTGSSTKEATGTAVADLKQDTGNRKNTAVVSPAADSPRNIISPNTEAEQANRLIAKLDRPFRTSSRRNGSSHASGTMYASGFEKISPIYTYNDHVPSVADRYIMLMTPDGNLIRMSKKLGNLVCCVSGEDPEADCKDQLKKWQEKLATSSLTTSAGNFMDILSIVNSLDEGTDL